eukprot:3183129-Rhodomonas_salina.3
MQKLLACYRKQPSSLVDLCRQVLLSYRPTRVLRAVRYCRRACDALSGTADARATRCPVLPTRVRRAVWYCLRASYALSSTGCYRPTRVRCHTRSGLLSAYAMSGTGPASGAFSLRACYAVSGTDRAHGPTRCAVLTSAMLLPAPSL